MIRTRQYLLAIGDFTMCVIALAAMIMLRFGATYDRAIVGAHAISFAGIFVLWLLVFFVFNLYDVRSINPSPRTIGMLGVAMTAAVILGGFVFYIHPALGISPRTNLALVGIFSFVLIVVWRRVFYRRFTSFMHQRIALVGDRPEIGELASEIGKHPEIGVITAVLGTEEARGKAAEIGASADIVILESYSPELAAAFSRTNAKIRTLVDAYQEFFARIPVSLMNDELASRIASRRERHSYEAARRVLEILFSAGVLIATSPFVLIACIAKRLEDGGPAILKTHLRVGKNGKYFHAYKIRSMIVDADKSGMQWTSEHDPRITPVGRILRKLHIDEVPQFWNVLKGDMALVGPRPEQPKFVTELEKEIPYYHLRSTVTPGFTGWAQIKFRYARTVSDSSKKWEYDLYYLMNRNLLLDIGIVLKTIQIIFTH